MKSVLLPFSAKSQIQLLKKKHFLAEKENKKH